MEDLDTWRLTSPINERPVNNRCALHATDNDAAMTLPCDRSSQRWRLVSLAYMRCHIQQGCAVAEVQFQGAKSVSALPSESILW
jgi:hypothetical protein